MNMVLFMHIPHALNLPGHLESRNIIVSLSDSQLSKSRSPSFPAHVSSYVKLNGQGEPLPDEADSWEMVKDSSTGLTWEVKQNEDGIKDFAKPHDADNTYTWFDDSDPEANGGYAGTRDPGEDTQSFLKMLNDSRFGGYSDWRLPTIQELATLVDRGRTNPAIDTRYFPQTISSNYWSSTTHPNSGGAWSIGFYYGYDNFNYKSNRLYVRAVRGKR